MSTIHYLPALTSIDLANVVYGKLPEKFHVQFDNMVDEGTNNLRKTYLPPVSFYQNDDIEETGDDAYFVQNVYLELPEGRNKFLLEYSYHYGDLEVKIESDLLTRKMHSEGS